MWEEFHRLPRLKLLEVIKGKSLDELDELMLQFERDFKDLDSNPVPSQTIAIEVETHAKGRKEGPSPARPLTSRGSSVLENTPIQARRLKRDDGFCQHGDEFIDETERVFGSVSRMNSS